MSHGQVNFRKEYEDSNLISLDADPGLDERVSIHESMLAGAVSTKDKKQQLFANLHLFLDYIKKEDYVEASTYLLESERIANESRNKSWIGWVAYRSGMLYIRIGQEEKAIENHEIAVQSCGEAGDSLCVGEAMEQIAALEAVLKNHEKAADYYARALPILEKYGADKHRATVLNNYGNFLMLRGEYDRATPLQEQGIALSLKISNYKSAAKGMNNMATSYRLQGQYDRALEEYQRAIALNKEHGFDYNLIRNYLGMHLLYLETKDYEKSIDYLMERNALKDSLSGEQVQKHIADLEAKYESEKQQLAIEKSQTKLLTTRRYLERSFGFIGFLFLLTLFGWIYYRMLARTALAEKVQAEQELKNITAMLIAKNTTILELNSRLAEQQKVGDIEENELSDLVSSTILTSDDWTTYKSSFEKIYPGYMYRLRSEYSTLSEAEERLFLLIKVNLKSREIASILGISIDSVRKTRQRLRKRLELDKSDSLESFIKRY